MEQVAENVFRLGSKSHNWYLMFEDAQVTVIDAGCVREWRKLIRGLAANGVGTEQVAGFMITHVHGDHFGMAARATDEHLRVAVHADDEPRARGTYEGRFSAEASDLPVYKPSVLMTFLPMLLAGVSSLGTVGAVETFQDGQTLDVPGHPTAIHTPGHTEGHTMFHCADQGILFTGDGLVTMDLLGPRTGPQHMNGVFDVDSDQAHASLERIVGLEANLLLPGHGKPWDGSPADAVARARS